MSKSQGGIMKKCPECKNKFKIDQSCIVVVDRSYYSAEKNDPTMMECPKCQYLDWIDNFITVNPKV